MKMKNIIVGLCFVLETKYQEEDFMLKIGKHLRKLVLKFTILIIFALYEAK